MVKVRVDATLERCCPAGFIPTYLDYVGEQESPQDFHLWVAISCIATALGRDVYVDRKHWETYPNLYIILVGASALTHKSASIKIGTRLLAPALGEAYNPTSQKLSPEYLIHKLAQSYEELGKSEVFIKAGELANLLGQSRLDDSILKVLTDLWDSDDRWEYGTLSRGEETCYNLCLNMLAGSTVDWLKGSLPEESLTTGFFSRLVVVSRPFTGLKYPHLAGEGDDEERQRLEKDLIQDLKAISLIEGEFVWSEKAREMYEDWYCDHNHPETKPKQLQGYYGRKGDFIIKICMIHSAGKSDKKVITEEDMMFSLRVLNENEQYLQGIVNFMGTSEEGKKRNIILDILKKERGWVSKSTIAQRTSHRYNAEERRMAFESLIEEKVIKAKTSSKGGMLYKYNPEKEE